MSDLSFPSAAQHIALQEYRDAIAETEQRIDRLTEQLRQEPLIALAARGCECAGVIMPE